jgi:hypothetical protein
MLMLESSSDIYYVRLWILQKTLAGDRDVVDNIVEEEAVVGLEEVVVRLEELEEVVARLEEEGVAVGLEEEGSLSQGLRPDTEKNHRFFSTTLFVLCPLESNNQRRFVSFEARFSVVWLPQVDRDRCQGGPLMTTTFVLASSGPNISVRM